MQDITPVHGARSTLLDLDRRGINRLVWPPTSPDLNPIEDSWNRFKEYIEDMYRDEKNPTTISLGAGF